MNRRFVFLSSLGFLLIIFLAVFFKPSLPQPTHYHAGFIIYKNGVRQDFSASQYMEPVVCELPGQTGPETDTSTDTVHLHNNIGDVVHVHRSDAVWGDVAQTLKVDDRDGVTGYRQGRRVFNILSQPIRPNDSVILIIGSPEGINVSETVSLERIREAEQQVEGC